MTTSRPHLALVLAAIALAATGSAGAARAAGGPYGWPVKPFHAPHPIRGSFGDPRTVFSGPPTRLTLLSGGGSFQFHFGVDISAPDGTAVYPVESGTVARVSSEWLSVGNGAGRVFQYWHIKPLVPVGRRVVAGVTVLGRILRDCGHVHLTEIDDGVDVNPLQAGHLTPYGDTTAPTVASIEFRRSVASADVLPELVNGRLEIVAAAYDLPTLHVAAPWSDLPVTPAVVSWRIQTPAGRVVVPARTVYDVRSTLPRAPFWTVYARGTHQNMSVFGRHYSYMQPGTYLFRLAPGGFDTRTLRDGVYELVVTASDIAGNTASLSQRFCVGNATGAGL